MKIPLVWLRDYIETEKSAKEIAESFTLLGLLLDIPAETVLETKVLDLEHRMDRSDWLSIIGCARDLAAFEGTELKYPQSYKKNGKKLSENEKITIKVDCPDLVYRFNTRVFKNVNVKESPDWLKQRLDAYGITPINNVVDITNFVMVEYGQPLHAQDTAKMQAREIVIRKAREGEQITTLLGETLKLNKNNFVLTQNDKPTVIGGIVGGIETSIDESTREIVLDAGNYNQIAIRKASRKLKVQNETVMRYDKFLNPELTQIAIERAAQLLIEIAEGEYYENDDWYPKKTESKNMKFRLERLKRVSGMDFEMQRVKEIMHALEYKIINDNGSEVTVEVPYFRTDVEVEDDIVADVLRINNYKNISSSPINTPPPKEITPKIYKFEQELRDIMTSLGGHEHIGDPLVKYNEQDKKQIRLVNALTAEKSALRTQVYDTLINVLPTYRKHKINRVGVFEVGKRYRLNSSDSNNNFTEERVLTYIYQDTDKTLYEINNYVKRVLSALLLMMGISEVSYKKDGKTTKIYEDGTELGCIGIDTFCIITEALMNASRPQSRVKHSIPNLTTIDLSVVINIGEKFNPIYIYIKQFSDAIERVEIIEEYTDEKILGKDKKAVLIRLHLNTPIEREKLIKDIKEKFAVDIRI